MIKYFRCDGLILLNHSGDTYDPRHIRSSWEDAQEYTTRSNVILRHDTNWKNREQIFPGCREHWFKDPSIHREFLGLFLCRDQYACHYCVQYANLCQHYSPIDARLLCCAGTYCQIQWYMTGAEVQQPCKNIMFLHGCWTYALGLLRHPYKNFIKPAIILSKNNKKKLLPYFLKRYFVCAFAAFLWIFWNFLSQFFLGKFTSLYYLIIGMKLHK